MKVKDAQQTQQRAISTKAENIVKVLESLILVVGSLSLGCNDVHFAVSSFLVLLNKLFRVKCFKFDDVDSLVWSVTSHFSVLRKTWNFLQLAKNPLFEKDAAHSLNSLACLVLGNKINNGLSLLEHICEEVRLARVDEDILVKVLSQRVDPGAVVLALASQSKTDAMIVIVPSAFKFHLY